MPYDPTQNIFAQQLASMPPDQAQVAPNGVPMSLVPPAQYAAMKAQAMPAPQSTDILKPGYQTPSQDPAAAPAQPAPGIAKYLKPKTSPGEDAMTSYANAAKAALGDQQGGINDLQDYINKIKDTPQGINWSPLAALADSMNPGSHLAATAQAMAPMSAEDKQKYLMQLQGQLVDKRANLSKENLQSLATQMQMQQQRDHERAQEANWASEANTREAGVNGGGRVGVMMGNQAIAAGQAFEKDPIIHTSKDSLNSLTRSSSILENPSKPVTSKDLNLAYNDYINAVAKGGAATEGKIARELPETFEQEWNELKQKTGTNDDLRKDPKGKELIDLLSNNIRTVRGDLGGAMSSQAKNLEQSFGAIDNNPMVAKTVKAKMDLYGDPIKNSGITPQAAQGPHGASVTQNGHTYNWNPSTGKYE